jgi:integrase
MGARSIQRADVEAVLQHVADAGLSRQSTKHLKNGIAAVLAPYYPDAPVTVLGNGRKCRLTPAVLASLPVFERKVVKERARLTDQELALYWAWEPPEAVTKNRLRGNVTPGEWRIHAVLERKVMALVSRCLGGARAGDLHSMRWEWFDAEGGAFTTGWIARNKTRRPQRHLIADELRPVLKRWWSACGQPVAGLLFPALRGERAGEGAKQGVSHADALRRDLRAVMKWASSKQLPGAVAEGSARWRELFEETEFTRPVDFHSFRRAFADGLEAAGLSEPEMMRAGGWSTPEAMNRYPTKHRTVAIPSAALPRLGSLVPSRAAARSATRGSLPSTLQKHSAGDTRFEPVTLGSGGRCSIQLS